MGVTFKGKAGLPASKAVLPVLEGFIPITKTVTGESVVEVKEHEMREPWRACKIANNGPDDIFIAINSLHTGWTRVGAGEQAYFEYRLPIIKKIYLKSVKETEVTSHIESMTELESTPNSEAIDSTTWLAETFTITVDYDVIVKQVQLRLGKVLHDVIPGTIGITSVSIRELDAVSDPTGVDLIIFTLEDAVIESVDPSTEHCPIISIVPTAQLTLQAGRVYALAARCPDAISEQTVSSDIQDDTDAKVGFYGNGRDLCRESGGRLWHGYRDITRMLIAIAYSDDEGQTWTEDKTIASDVISLMYLEVSLAIDSNDNVHCLYTRLEDASPAADCYNYLAHTERDKATGNWSGEEIITTVTDYDIGSLCLFIDDADLLHVVYISVNISDFPTTTAYALFYVSRDESENWGTPEEVAYTAGYWCWCCSGAVDSSGKVHIVFTADGYGTYPYAYQLIYVAGNAGSWDAPVVITDDVDDTYNGQWFPCIVLDSSDDVGVLWQGDGYGVNDTIYNIHFTRIVDGVVQAIEHVTDVADEQGVGYPAYGAVLGLSIDQSGVYHAIWRGDGWGDNPTVASIQHRVRTDGVWGAQDNLINESRDRSPWQPLWAKFPSHQILASGYIFAYEANKISTSQSDHKFMALVEAPNYLYWEVKGSNVYLSGNYVKSEDGGQTWAHDVDKDLWFEISCVPATKQIIGGQAEVELEGRY